MITATRNTVATTLPGFGRTRPSTQETRAETNAGTRTIAAWRVSAAEGCAAHAPPAGSAADAAEDRGAGGTAAALLGGGHADGGGSSGSVTLC